MPKKKTPFINTPEGVLESTRLLWIQVDDLTLVVRNLLSDVGTLETRVKNLETPS